MVAQRLVKFVGTTVGQESGAGHDGTGAIGMKVSIESGSL